MSYHFHLLKIFQSTPPRGWRLGEALGLPEDKQFQSTPPRGWRLYPSPSMMQIAAFQSTPPRGWRRNGRELIHKIAFISIHSTARVETISKLLGIPFYNNFNPLHREGGDEPGECYRYYIQEISIHSTARVETAILHNNHYYSSSHFHKQIISHPPQITANHPCTLANPFSLCKFSGANPPVNPCLLQVRTKILYTALPPAARSEYQRFFHINPLIHPNMVHFCSVFIPKVVKPKAVRLFINYICQYRL